MPLKPRAKASLIFVCSPLAAETPEATKANIQQAAFYCREVTKESHFAFAPQLHYPQFLDGTPAEREVGILAALRLLEHHDEVRVYGWPTQGMTRVMKRARELGIRVKLYDAENPRECLGIFQDFKMDGGMLIHRLVELPAAC